MKRPQASNTPQTPAQERLSGNIERVTFHSEESGFCVLRVHVKGHRELVTVVGSAASVTPGECIEALGQWHNDRNHGLQFKAETLHTVPPNSLEGMEKYLGSGMVRGIGPHFARKLVHAYGLAVFDVIENTPDMLLDLPGIGPKRKASVVSAWTEQKAVREIMVFLQSHGVGTSRAVRIYKTYGDEAIIRVTENPYRLALDIHGIGFKTADTIAGRLGVPPDSLIRAEAGVRHSLKIWSEQGHCAAPIPILLEKTMELLEVSEELVAEAIASELEAGNVMLESTRLDSTLTESLIYLVPLYRAETGCASHVCRLLAGPPPWGKIDLKKALPKVEAQTGLILSESQRQAVQRVLRSKLSIVTGGPGVGKTTLLNSLLLILRSKRLNILLCAPTGRAAKRMAETTDMEARTVHRLLEFDPGEFRFKRNEENPLLADLVVVDEASMLDVTLAHQLLRAIPDRAGLLIVGDVDQLPSVGPGNVLADLIESGVVPTVRLTEIFRQAQSSKIITNAHRINQGFLPEAPAKGEDSDFYLIEAQDPEEIAAKLIQTVTERIPARFGFDPVADIQVLTPMNRGGLGVHALNAELQKLLNGQAEPRVSKYGATYAPGDKVMQMVNNYDKEVFNGDIGRILSIDREDGSLEAVFDGRRVKYDLSELDEMSLAYAASIHKSQGSEYPVVVIPLAMQHYMLLERNLLYTAVTRGSKLVVVIAEPKALGMAVRNRNSKRRITWLTQRLGGESAIPDLFAEATP